MAGILIEVTSRLLMVSVRLSRSVSTLAVPQNAPKTGSLLPLPKIEIAERNISVLPLNDSGSGSYTFICVPLLVFINLGHSSAARLKPKASRQLDRERSDE